MAIGKLYSLRGRMVLLKNQKTKEQWERGSTYTNVRPKINKPIVKSLIVSQKNLCQWLFRIKIVDSYELTVFEFLMSYFSFIELFVKLCLHLRSYHIKKELGRGLLEQTKTNKRRESVNIQEFWANILFEWLKMYRESFSYVSFYRKFFFLC